jgi:hypothetical protein
MNLTTYIHLVPKLRMSGPLYMLSWHGWGKLYCLINGAQILNKFVSRWNHGTVYCQRSWTKELYKAQSFFTSY